MMKNIHSKHEYYNEHLKKEREQLRTITQQLLQLKEDARNNLNKINPDCHKCWYSLYKLDYNYMFDILKNNQHIKKSYVDILFSLQNHLILIYYMNTISMTTIFKTPFRLFFLSSLLVLINLCVQGEIFIADAPNAYYTLIIGICTFLFSTFLFLKIMNTLLDIIYYQNMKNILSRE